MPTASLARSDRLPMTRWCLGVMTVAVGATVLIGWVAAVPALTRWWAPADTRPLSALGLALAGASLAIRESRGPVAETVRRVLAALTAVIGVMVLIEWTVQPLGTIDGWLRRGHGEALASSRPAAHVALALVLFGITLACSGRRPRAVRVVAGLAGIGFAATALIIDVGFIMGAHVLIGPSRAQGVPAPTAFAVFLLGNGLVISFADHRPMRWLWDADLAGRLTRRLIPPAVLLPLALGIAYLLASVDGRLDPRGGLVMLTSGMVIALLSLVTLTGSLVERMQRERDNLTRQLDAFFAHTPASMSLRARDGVFLRVNRRFVEQTHLDADSIVGAPMDGVYPQELLSWAKAEIDEVLNSGTEVRSEVQADLGDGVRDFDVTRFPVLDNAGEIVGVGTLTYDVTERRAAEEALRTAERRYRELSERDPLTGLYNRRRFREALNTHLDVCRSSTPRGSLISIDLDGFKDVNDRLGHDMGDQLLVAVGQALASRLRTGDLVARHGGDEFLVLLHEGGEHEATTVALAILDAVRLASRRLDPTIGATASVGVVVIADLAPADLNATDIMRTADRALYASKNGGRDRLSVGTE